MDGLFVTPVEVSVLRDKSSVTVASWTTQPLILFWVSGLVVGCVAAWLGGDWVEGAGYFKIKAQASLARVS